MNYEQITPYIEKKLVTEQRHPECEDLAIFNYSQTCQFEQAWDEVTRQCRGLIMNVKTGEIIARPFSKFFNYGEHISKGWAIPTTEPEIYEKLDGSLGIMYTLNDKTWIATRGSFMSHQAQWATKWWRENKGDEPYGYEITHLFEIIYPENRIVVNYDFSGLVHLASVETATGKTVDAIMPVRKASKINAKSIEELAKLDEPNSEGFVIFYPEENVRMKIKFPEYVRLHKLITGVSEIAIWEHLRDGNDLQDVLEKVPDEFFKWVKDVQNNLWGKYKDIENSAMETYEAVKGLETRKEQAIAIMKSEHSSVVFAMLDKKDYKPLIWKMLRPHGRSQFKVDIDL